MLYGRRRASHGCGDAGQASTPANEAESRVVLRQHHPASQRTTLRLRENRRLSGETRRSSCPHHQPTSISQHQRQNGGYHQPVLEIIVPINAIKNKRPSLSERPFGISLVIIFCKSPSWSINDRGLHWDISFFSSPNTDRSIHREFVRFQLCFGETMN